MKSYCHFPSEILASLKIFPPWSVNETKAKLITKGHMNVQNYANMKHAEKVEPGKFYDLEFELQPTFYRLPAGARLGLIIYSTDQGMTKRPLEEETYTIDLDRTQLIFHEM